MANEEHVKILKQGTKVWNEWRRANPVLHPDLSGADLSQTSLTTLNPIGRTSCADGSLC